MTISILLADDHPVVRRGLRDVLQAYPDFAIAGEAENGLDTVRLVERLRPNVLVLDLMLPGLNGLDVLPVVRQRSPETNTVIFSMYANEDFVLQALKKGAHGYVLKGCDPAEAAQAIRCAAAGRRYLCTALSRLGDAVAGDVEPGVPVDRHDLLTPRERETLQLAAEGHSAADIGKRLFISPRTAEMHRAKAMRKLGLKTQAELIRYAIRKGMISAEV